MSEDNGEIDGIAESVKEKDETENGGDELLQMIAELRLENEFLRSQFKEVDSSQAQVKQLEERLQSLSREIEVEKQTRVAAEQALEHLRESYSEGDDAKAQQYSQGLPYLNSNRIICHSFAFFFSLFSPLLFLSFFAA